MDDLISIEDPTPQGVAKAKNGLRFLLIPPRRDSFEMTFVESHFEKSRTDGIMRNLKCYTNLHHPEWMDQPLPINRNLRIRRFISESLWQAIYPPEPCTFLYIYLLAYYLLQNFQ